MTTPERLLVRPMQDGARVPFYAMRIGDRYDLRILDPEQLETCIREQRCYICGERLGQRMAFVVSPLSLINHMTAEPAAHRGCALHVAQKCPFIAKGTDDADDDLLDSVPPALQAGRLLRFTPGVCAIITTQTFRVQRFGDGVLINFSSIESIGWFARGAPANRRDVLEAFDVGLRKFNRFGLGDDEVHSARVARALQHYVLAVLPPMSGDAVESATDDGGGAS